MAVGCVHIAPGHGAQHGSDAIASLAAIAKRRAKQEASGLVVIDGGESATLLPTLAATASAHANANATPA